MEYQRWYFYLQSNLGWPLMSYDEFENKYDISVIFLNILV